MSYLRKIVYCVAALMLAAVALSASAGGPGNNKAITLDNVSGQPAVLGATLQPGTYNIQLLLINSGQSGNASSAEIDFTNAPGFTVNSATLAGSKGPVIGVAGAQTPGNFKGFQFTYTLPNKSSVVVTLNVTVAAGSTCGAPQVVWQPYAWTGGVGTPSTSFPSPALGTYTTNLAGAPNCMLSFVSTSEPADAFVGAACAPLTCLITTAPFNSFGAPVQVKATQNGSPVSGVSVTIGNTGTCSIASSGTTDNTGTASLTSISSTSAGTGCQLTASASGFTSATSSVFTVVALPGILACLPAAGSTSGGLGSILAAQYGTPPVYQIPGVGAPDYGLIRGENRDATCTYKVPFTFTVDGSTNTALFTEDSLGQQTSVEYIIRWAPVNVDSDGWSERQPCVAWGMETPTGPNPLDPVLCGGDYVPALACLADDVNAPGDGTGEVMPYIPSVAPFTSFSATDHPQYMPLDSLGHPQRAKVCVSQQGWTATNGQVQYWTKIIDQADSGIRLP